MINVNEVKEYAEFLAKKWQSGGSLAPNEFNLLLPNIQRDIIRKYYGVPEEYHVGRPQAHISYEVTQLVSDYLDPFKKVVDLTIDDNGIATIPDDYLHKSSLRYRYAVQRKVNKWKRRQDYATPNNDCSGGDTLQLGASELTSNETIWNMVPVRIVNDMQFDWETGSAVRQPSKEYPIARLFAGKIQFAPQDLKVVQFGYIRKPKDPVWGYTTNNGVTTYNPATSINIELPEICASEFVMAILQKLGISIRENNLINWADKTRQMGS